MQNTITRHLARKLTAGPVLSCLSVKPVLPGMLLQIQNLYEYKYIQNKYTYKTQLQDIQLASQQPVLPGISSKYKHLYQYKYKC